MKKSVYISMIFLILGMFCYNTLAEPTIVLVQPEPDETISNTTPVIIVEYSDPDGIDIETVKMRVNNIDVTLLEDSIRINDNNITYTVGEIFELEDGNQTVLVEVNGISNEWIFYVDTGIVVDLEEGIDIFSIIYWVIIGTILFFIGFTLYIIYLKKTKKFTFEKYFAQHEIKREYFVLYIPLVLAFLFSILGLALVTSEPGFPDFSTEFVVIIGLFVGLAPYAVDSQIERKKLAQYERAFSQFLFEMADAMRGGLDPTKALIELAKTDTSILKDHIKRASEGIKLGRPFDEVMKAMTRNIKSDLIQRYSSLVGETSKIGGETAQVIFRAAKDMDDFIKINDDRRRQLTTQVTTVYIAIIVLLIILFQLATLFPSLEGLDTSLLTGGGGLEAAGQAKVIERMDFFTIKQRFFHLVTINSLGTGTIIGMFIDGKVKYGLMHSLILTTVTTIFFVIMILYL